MLRAFQPCFLFQLIIAAVTELDAKLFEAYLENRVEPVTEAIEPAMYAGGFNWSECLNPTAVRPYIKMALMNVVAIHAEVNNELFKENKNVQLFNIKGSINLALLIRQVFYWFLVANYTLRITLINFLYDFW